LRIDMLNSSLIGFSFRGSEYLTPLVAFF